MGFDTLAPWDTIRYFQSPKETTYNVPSNAIQLIAPYNLYRVGLLICNPATGQNFVISTKPNLAATDGFLISGTYLPFMITHRDFGVLVQSAWYALNVTVGSAFINVIEVLLNTYPERCKHETRAIIQGSAGGDGGYNGYSADRGERTEESTVDRSTITERSS